MELKQLHLLQMKNTAYYKPTLVGSDKTISKFVGVLLDLWICKNIKTMEKCRNPVTTITRYGAPTYMKNIVLILILSDVKSDFTFGKWGENMTVDLGTPCTLSEDCDAVGVPPKCCDVFLHPEQSCRLVLQPIVARRFVVSCTQKS
jgi:hypothetical protein